MNKLITLITIFTFIFFSGIVYSQTNCESARKKYLELNPDVAKAGMDAWSHYISYGKNEGRAWPICAEEKRLKQSIEAAEIKNCLICKKRVPGKGFSYKKTNDYRRECKIIEGVSTDDAFVEFMLIATDQNIGNYCSRECAFKGCQYGLDD